MFRVKKFLNLIALVMGGLFWVLLPSSFCVSQSFELYGNSLLNNILHFKMPNNSLYLYAEFQPNTYKIYFDGNGSTSGSMDSMDMVYDEEKFLLENKYIKDGSVFQGWSTTTTGMVEYLNQDKVKNLTAEDLGIVVLYAQRLDTEVPYTIEYYQENVDGTGYDLVGTGSGYGPVGPYIISTGYEYTGFTLQTGAEVSIISGGIVPYYYTRNSYNLIVKDRDNVLLNTGIKYGTDIPLPSNPEWTGNTFDGWNNLPGDGKMPANDIVLTSKRTYGEHTIVFDTDGGTEILPITKNYGEVIEIPENPTRAGYEFVGWEPKLPNTMPYDDITVRAIWKEIGKGTGWSGRGGRGGTSSVSEGKPHGSATGAQTGDQIMEENVDFEVLFAYMWAHDMGIIEMSWKDSDPDGYVTRGDMAEMVIKFTENVLKQKIPEPVPENCVWGDSDKQWNTPETKVYAQKACALGVMGIRMQNFMPNKILDRAEFGTILSRLLWGDKYDVVDASKTNLYYTRHLEALNERKIMIKIDNPERKKELRKWAWLMLMRARIEKNALLEEQVAE